MSRDTRPIHTLFAWVEYAVQSISRKGDGNAMMLKACKRSVRQCIAHVRTYRLQAFGISRAWVVRLMDCAA